MGDVMMSQVDQIAQQALNLDPDDRAYLADLLEQSLPGQGFATPEIADAWSKELDRRIAAYERGETRAMDLETSLDQMRDALALHRAKKSTP